MEMHVLSSNGTKMKQRTMITKLLHGYILFRVRLEVLEHILDYFRNMLLNNNTMLYSFMIKPSSILKTYSQNQRNNKK
jgi:hypothetical protein